jgi:hypothetical protein
VAKAKKPIAGGTRPQRAHRKTTATAVASGPGQPGADRACGPERSRRPIRLGSGKVRNLNGRTVNDVALIGSHGDVTSPAITWAFASLVASI